MGIVDGGGGDFYFYLWSLTEAGARDAGAVASVLRTASAMVRSLGGECHLYITAGSDHDMIGVAEKIDDAKAVRIKHAVDGLGLMRTTLVKTTEFSLTAYDGYARDVTRLKSLKP